MFVIKPKLNKKITIVDTATGTEFCLFFYYQKGGRPALAFDIPDSIRIFNSAKKARKDESNATANV